MRGAMYNSPLLIKKEYNHRYYLRHRKKLIAAAIAYEAQIKTDPRALAAWRAARSEQHAKRMQNPEWVAKRRANHKKVDAKRRGTPEQLAQHAAAETIRRVQPHRRDKHRKNSSNFQKRNKNYVKARKALRRAREANAEGAWSAADFAAILVKQNNICFYCSDDITDRHHADHYIPLARGGSNWPSNIVAACADCNHRKGDKLPEEFSGRRLSAAAALDPDSLLG
jgi:5-methylcytosine-specific restriction endonuclease McrA